MDARLQPEEVTQQIKSMLSRLDAKMLYQAFKEGQKNYYLNVPQTEDQEAKSVMKTIFTLGLSDLFRIAKSHFRIPSKAEIEASDPKEVLRNFLAGSGGDDRLSLKYRVLHALLNSAVVAENDRSAARLVKMTQTELGPIADISLVVSGSVRSKMEQDHESIFNLNK